MLAIEDLSVEYYRRGRTIPALRGVSLTLRPGETVGLVGESGSGKSTLALAVLRLIGAREGRITGGRILFEGRNLLVLPEEAMRGIRGGQIAMIFQDPFTALNPVLRIDRQLAEAGGAHGRPSSTAALREALEQVQLDPSRILGSYPHQLSGGQRQRVLIAMALLGRPRFLLADEPTTALDVLVQKDILELLFRLQKDLSLAMLLISHNLAIVAEHSDRVIVMKDGQVVEEAPPDRLFRQPAHDYTRRLIEAIPRLEGRPG